MKKSLSILVYFLLGTPAVVHSQYLQNRYDVGSNGTDIFYSTDLSAPSLRSYKLYLHDERPEDYQYVFPKNYELRNEDGMNILVFKPALYSIKEKLPNRAKKRGEIFHFEVPGKKDKNNHYGIYTEPHDFKEVSATWSLPQGFEFVSFTCNQEGEWVESDSKLTYFAKDVNNLVFDVKWRRIPAEVLVKALSGRIIDSLSSDPILAAINFISSPNNKQYMTAYSDEEDGFFEVYIKEEGSIKVEIHAEGYEPKLIENFPGGEVKLSPIVPDEVIAIENVLFLRGQDIPLQTSLDELDKLAKLLNDDSELSVMLYGHTDNQGDPEKNIALSVSRVSKVKAYLMNRGVAAERISGEGYGETIPIADNTDPKTRRLNRRVEVKLTKSR